MLVLYIGIPKIVIIIISSYTVPLVFEVLHMYYLVILMTTM